MQDSGEQLAIEPVCSVQGTAAMCALQTSSHLPASTPAV